MDRRFMLSGWVQGQEDDPEYLGRSSISWDVTLSDNQRTDSWVRKWTWGGECRGEVYFDVSLGERDIITLHGTILLYEGASVDTGDLDGKAEFDLTLPPGRAQVKDTVVYNEDEEEYDTWFQVKFTAHNGAAQGPVPA